MFYLFKQIANKVSMKPAQHQERGAGGWMDVGKSSAEGRRRVGR